MRRNSFLILFALLLLPLGGCKSEKVSEDEMKDLMIKHRPGYAETQGKEGKGGTPPGGKAQRP